MPLLVLLYLSSVFKRCRKNAVIFHHHLCSASFERIEKESELIWKFHLYGLVNEYYEVPFLPSPLNILSLVYSAASWIWMKCLTRYKFIEIFTYYKSIKIKHKLYHFLSRCLLKHISK